MPFGRQTNKRLPASHTPLFRSRASAGVLKKNAGKKRPRDETYVPDAQFNANDDLVGGDTFRGKNQHEGLPTALAEAYANGAKDKVENRKRYTSFKSSGMPWDTFTRKAYDAGFTLGDAYSPLTEADAVRSLTARTVLASPERDSAGNALKVAGFHPSSISKSVSESAYAHQKVFEAQAAVLTHRAENKLSSNEAADIAIAAIHLASLAPGEFAAHAAFGKTAKSKMDGGALLPDKPDAYEDRRERLKRAIAFRAEALTASDRKAIHDLVDRYLESVEHKVLPSGVNPRKLGGVVAGDTKPAITSPLRRTPTPSLNPPRLQLGEYEKPPKLLTKPAVVDTIAEAAFQLREP